MDDLNLVEELEQGVEWNDSLLEDRLGIVTPVVEVILNQMFGLGDVVSVLVWVEEH